MAEFEDEDSGISVPLTEDTPKGTKVICVQLRPGAAGILKINETYTLNKKVYKSCGELIVELVGFSGNWWANQFEIL